MKKAESHRSVEGPMRDEYDFRGGVRGRYVHEPGPDGQVVLLEPDVADAFPDDAAVNEALRVFLREHPERTSRD